jgi:hypothetical protein
MHGIWFAGVWKRIGNAGCITSGMRDSRSRRRSLIEQVKRHAFLSLQ